MPKPKLPKLLMPPNDSNHLFQSASNILITGGSFYGAQNNLNDSFEADSNTKLLHSKVAWNAILNAAGRADSVRCYPGTREAVMTHIENWIGGGDGSPRIFWLSGPAGAGKSAIAQSIAERCHAHGIPTAHFFFFRADPTRNHAAPLVATLLHQLFTISPALKDRVHDFIAENPFIFDTSVDQQLRALMMSALDYDESWPVERKIVLILDGLDECSSDNNSWVVQQDILRTLHYIVAQNDSPFILLISSRAEPHLIMLFNEFQSHVSRLYLDGESYSSSDDIRIFVEGELEKIKATHHLSWSLPLGWPSTTIIDAIVRKSSGHFIYAATVMRFVQISPDSPLLSLEKVEGIRPVENDTPFAQLDAVYLHILSKARNWAKTRDILAAQTLPDPQDALRSLTFYQSDTPRRSTVLLDALGYSITEIGSYTAELTALVKVEHQEIRFYHSSFGDFLLDRGRSDKFFIDLEEFRLKLVPALFYGVGGVKDHLSWSLVLEHFTSLTTTSHVLTEALLSSSLLLSGLAFTGPTLCLFLIKIQELYAETNEYNYRRILTGWLTWFHKNHGTLHAHQLDSIRYAGEIWNDLAQTLTVRTETTKKKSNATVQSVPPSNSSSFSFITESAISELLQAQVKLGKQAHHFHSLPQGEKAVVYRGTTTGPGSLSKVSRHDRGQTTLGHTEQSAPRPNSSDDVKDLKSEQVNSVQELYSQCIEMSLPGLAKYGSPPARSPLLKTLQPYIVEQTPQMPQGPLLVQEQSAEDNKHAQPGPNQHFIEYLRGIFPTNIENYSTPPERREEFQSLPDAHDSMPQPHDAAPPQRAASPLKHANVDVVNSSETQVLHDAYAQMIGSASANELFSIRADAVAATAEITAARAEIASARLTHEEVYAEAKSILDAAKKEAKSIRDEANKLAMSGRIEVFAARDEYRLLMAKHGAMREDIKIAQIQVEEAKAKAGSVREEIIVAQAELFNIRDEISSLTWRFTPTQFTHHPGSVGGQHESIFL